MAKRTAAGTAFQKKGKCLRLIRYVRVSDTTGREDTLISPEVQINATDSYVQRNGHTIVETITELDRSGRESSKRRIAEIINMVEAGEADGVVVWKVSRWGRNTLDSMLNLGELQSVGGVLLSATENLDEVDTPVGKFQLTLLLAVAQMFSDEIGKTWANIHDYRRSIGLPAVGGERFGYKRVDSGYEIDPTSGPWLRDAYRRYVAGESLSSIAKAMDAAGILTTRGNRMTYNSLIAVMDAGFAAGKIVEHRRGETIWHAGAHEALIDDDLWTRYLRKRSSVESPRTKHAPYRLAGLVFCAECGGKMHANWKYKPGGVKDGRYLRCFRGKGVRRNVTCASPAQIDEAVLNDMLVEWLRANSTGQSAIDAAMSRALKVDAANVDRQALEKKIAREERRLSILIDKVIDGTISSDAARAKEAEINAAIAALKALLDSIEVDIDVNSIPTPDAFGAVVAGWDVLDPAILNEGLRKVIRRIDIARHPERHRSAEVSIVTTWASENRLIAV